jgi:phage repressor protein C with HTH and peptisase S24 domain
MVLFSIASDLTDCQNIAVFHIGDLIRKLRDESGWSQEELGRRSDLNKETIVRIEAGLPSRTDTLERVAKSFGKNLAGLYSMLLSPPRADGGKRELLGDVEGEILDDVRDYKRDDIPIIQEGEASPNGLMWDAESKSLREIDQFTSRPSDYRERGAYAVVLRGDSMEPCMRRGMRLIISPNIAVGDGDIAYVQLKSGERLIKIATKTGDGWLLTSANPAYAPRSVKTDEIEHVHRVAYVRLLK